MNWEIHASALWSFTKNWRKVCPPLVNLIEIDQSFFFQLNTGPLPFDLVNQFGSTRRCIETWRPTRFQLFIFLFGVKLTNEGACLREDNLDNERLILKNADIVVQSLRGFESFVVVRWKLQWFLLIVKYWLRQYQLETQTLRNMKSCLITLTLIA